MAMAGVVDTGIRGRDGRPSDGWRSVSAGADVESLEPISRAIKWEALAAIGRQDKQRFRD